MEGVVPVRSVLVLVSFKIHRILCIDDGRTILDRLTVRVRVSVVLPPVHLVPQRFVPFARGNQVRVRQVFSERLCEIEHHHITFSRSQIRGLTPQLCLQTLEHFGVDPSRFLTVERDARRLLRVSGDVLDH